MITSLNINQNLNQVAIDYIEKHLKYNNDLVILHEVLPKDIVVLENRFKCYKPYYPNTANFYTIALTMLDSNNFDNIELQPFIKSQKNRTIFLLKEEDSSSQVDLVVGLHAPSHNYEKSDFASIEPFWSSLIDLLKNVNTYKGLHNYGIPKKIGSIIITGDLNAYKPSTERKRYFHKLLSVGFVDLWIQYNNANNKETYRTSEKDTGTRIDYSLISDESWEKYYVEIDDTTRDDKNGFTDHSAIITKVKK